MQRYLNTTLTIEPLGKLTKGHCGYYSTTENENGSVIGCWYPEIRDAIFEAMSEQIAAGYKVVSLEQILDGNFQVFKPIKCFPFIRISNIDIEKEFNKRICNKNENSI